MDATTLGIAIGVASGLVTSFLLLLIGWMWRQQLTPWMSNQIYQGIRVDGTWTLNDAAAGTENSPYSQRETLEIEQVAMRLTGRLILDPIDKSDLPSRTLKVEGSVRDGFVVLSCIPATRRNLGFVCYLGKVAGDGTELRGSSVYYHVSEDRIATVDAIYKRQTTS